MAPSNPSVGGPRRTRARRFRRSVVVALAFTALAWPAAKADPAPAPSPNTLDPRVSELREAVIPLRSIDPEDDDFSDFRAIKPLLGEARVVILGEATHGEGNTFLAKSRLIRYLHQELGFEVLAFESGFYDCWKAWQSIEAGEDPATAFRRSVFPIWTRSAQVQSLIDYFAAQARTSRPLRLAGTDPQFTGELSERHLVADLARIADVVGMPSEEFSEGVSAPLINLVEGRYEAGEIPSEAARSRFTEALASLESRLRASSREVVNRDFWLRVLENTRRNSSASWNTDFTRNLLEDPENYQVRESLMGENIVWLARQHPQRKIVVWTHSGHAARGLAGIEVPSKVHTRLYRTLRPAGAVAKNQLGDDLYVVGFLAYQGRYATVFREKPIEIWKPTEGSLEDLFHRTGLDLAFLDLSRGRRLPRWLRARTIARPVGYMEMRARWPTVFDGLIFLDRMEVSKAIPVPSPAPRDASSLR